MGQTSNQDKLIIQNALIAGRGIPYNIQYILVEWPGRICKPSITIWEEIKVSLDLHNVQAQANAPTVMSSPLLTTVE